MQIPTCMPTCKYLYIYTHTRAHILIHVYTHTHIYIYIHKYVSNICIHTHTHHTWCRIAAIVDLQVARCSPLHVSSCIWASICPSHLLVYSWGFHSIALLLPCVCLQATVTNTVIAYVSRPIIPAVCAVFFDPISHSSPAFMHCKTYCISAPPKNPRSSYFPLLFPASLYCKQ